MRALAVIAALGIAACTRTYVERPAPTQAPVVQSTPGATVITPPSGGSTVVVNPSY